MQDCMPLSFMVGVSVTVSQCDETNKVINISPSDPVQVCSLLNIGKTLQKYVSSVKFSAIIRLIQFVIFVADLTQLHLKFEFNLFSSFY